MNPIDIFLESERRNEFRCLVFKPVDHTNPNIPDDALAELDEFNTYPGPAFTHADAIKYASEHEDFAELAQPWIDHTKFVINSGEIPGTNYTLDFFALVLQFPHLKAETILRMLAEQGSGKTEWLEAIQKIMGKTFVAVHSAEEFLGAFNEVLNGIVMVYNEEAIFKGDKKSQNKLKALVTGRQMGINGKFKSAFRIHNYLWFVETTNDLVPTELFSRRYVDLTTSSKLIGKYDEGKKEYIRRLRAVPFQAVACVLYFRDISNFQSRDIPPTRGAQLAKMAGLNTFQSFIVGILEKAELPIIEMDPTTGGNTYCVEYLQPNEPSSWREKKELFEMFERYRSERQSSYTTRKKDYDNHSVNTFWRSLLIMLPSIESVRTTVRGKSVRMYRFPGGYVPLRNNFRATVRGWEFGDEQDLQPLVEVEGKVDEELHGAIDS